MTSDPEPVPAWGRIALSAYGPTALSSIGFGAVTPLVALSARDLGAGYGLAAFITSLLGLGQLLADLPAGWVAERLGERRAIVAACLVDAVALLFAFQSRSLHGLGAAVLVCGMSGAVFGLARQTYLTEVVPLRFRARAMSTLGGVFRIGGLAGPLAGAAVVASLGLPAAYAFAAVMSLIAAGVTLTLPDLPGENRGSADAVQGLPTVLRAHARTYLTQGVGAMLIMVVRSARQALIPLWCDANGLSAAATSLIFALSMAFDLALFFFGGSLMDRFGRVWVAAPAMLVMGLGLALLPLTHGAASITAVAALVGLGNGISSGVVMTLGSDASPAESRTRFLAGWRLMSDTGSMIGPLSISVLTLVAPLGVASLVLGLTGWAGAAWLLRVLPRRAGR